jgi:hypothetical protein
MPSRVWLIPICFFFSSFFYTFLCLLADPLGFEDPPLGASVAAWTCCWLDIIAVSARFLLCACPPFPTDTIWIAR